MAKRDIRLWPDPVLSAPCRAVDLDDPDLPDLITDLYDTMYAAKGRGLAAPQIAILKRVFVVDVTWKEGVRDPRVFINPQVMETTGPQVAMDEQCLSIPDLPMSVMRHEAVTLRWSSLDRVEHTARFDGTLARCIQHEFDHLNGAVIFDHQSPETRTTLEARYAP
ncbi:peptide deformylase [Pseudooctadecabacter jejudonensis]|uniref:Peptide deformylase n=1 Tax=Pseudooctadecabacter jejudonensis TaxID=1391910 RepID=A0A1Y5RZQ5_9RHOB|nr:peptide deformylase [Pseudooctadecabacter jejudonensis]SLN29436.1 Peptide deformylase [Pseudooctadecabacter jejudonensis]